MSGGPGRVVVVVDPGAFGSAGSDEPAVLLVVVVPTAPAAAGAASRAKTTHNVTGARRAMNIPFQVGILPPELQALGPPLLARTTKYGTNARIVSTPGHLAPGHILVGAGLTGKTEHPFAKNVFHDV